MSALERICALVAERTGASLSEHQIARLSAEVLRRLKATGRLRPGAPTRESEIERYLASLKERSGVTELGLLLASVAVHKTDLFRDAGQLEAFRAHVLVPLVEELRRPLRFWSAGCATGEEVATLLLMLAASGAHPSSSVLGTDLSERALTQARALRFRADVLPRIPAALAGTHLVREGAEFTLAEALRSRARFEVRNLMDLPYPRSEEGPFDVIFCRNVLIYFTPRAVRTVVERLTAALRPGGMLVLSAAEPFLDGHPELETIRLEEAFFYRRRAEGSARRAPRPSPETTRAVERPSPPAPTLTPLPMPAVLPRSLDRPTPAPVSRHDPSSSADPADRLEEVLSASAAGAPPEETERALRRCLFQDPHFAQARYLLGMLIEQRGDRADAASEYRRALAALRDGSARAVPFFLNPDRLQQACLRALARLGHSEAPPERRS